MAEIPLLVHRAGPERDGQREARAELKYAAPALERAARRAVPSAVYARRRHELAIRTLNSLCLSRTSKRGTRRLSTQYCVEFLHDGAEGPVVGSTSCAAPLIS